MLNICSEKYGERKFFTPIPIDMYHRKKQKTESRADLVFCAESTNRLTRRIPVQCRKRSPVPRENSKHRRKALGRDRESKGRKNPPGRCKGMVVGNRKISDET